MTGQIWSLCGAGPTRQAHIFLGSRFYKTELTRLTVGRLDLHRLCARDAIMISYKVWVWETIPSSSKFLLTFNTSLMLHMELGLTLTSWFLNLNLGHLIDTLWYLATLLLKVLLEHVELPHVLHLENFYSTSGPIGAWTWTRTRTWTRTGTGVWQFSILHTWLENNIHIYE